MKASEALMLGSTLLKPMSGVTNDGNGNGCAIGMIAAAMGKTYLVHMSPPADLDRTIEGLEKILVLPWMSKQVVFPCGCPHRADVIGALIHVFDIHVCQGHSGWTLERLADWLKTIEPQEQEETTCQEKVLDTVSSLA